MENNNSQLSAISSPLIRVAIIDDHCLLVDGLRRLIDESDVARVTAVYHNLQTSRQGLTAQTLPDVLLLDIQLPDGNGIEFCSELHREFPELKIVMLTMFSEITIVKRAMQSGAMGYMLKNSTGEKIIAAIKSVNRGETFICENIDIASYRSKEITALWLTRREKEVLMLIADGWSDPQIAEKIFLSPYTVKGIRRDLLTKFAAKNSVQLVQMAKEQMLI